MDLNIIQCVFVFFSLFAGVFGLLINCIGPYLPIFITRSYCYGKYSIKIHHATVAKCEVPKRWFRHFYILSVSGTTIMLCLIFYKYFFNGTIPQIMFTLFDILYGGSRKSLVSVESAILTIILLYIHVWKRVYETFYVSVFSDVKINIFHYLCGHLHYMGAIFSLVGESEIFVPGSRSSFSWHKLTTIELVCAFVFLWSSYMQLQTNFILRKLRKIKNNVIYDYKIPVDGLFKYISSPLQLTEIFMYLMLSGILWQASTIHYVTCWVVINQVECAFLSHGWYHNTFKNYPKERKILIPYIW